MPLDPGKLRHRITIQRPRVVQDGDGRNTTRWENVATSVPAEIVPVSVREFIAGQQMQSQITARIVIRYRDGLAAYMRIVGETRPYAGRIFNPAGWLNDPESGMEYLTAACSEGVGDGE